MNNSKISIENETSSLGSQLNEYMPTLDNPSLGNSIQSEPLPPIQNVLMCIPRFIKVFGCTLSTHVGIQYLL
ncbi:hypothetical protein ABKN59_007932 [Abortiporus biennis]